MMTLLWWTLSINLACFLPINGQHSSECGRKDYEKCVRLADPLLTDPHLIFPDNMVDVDHVCRTWSKFVDCIKSYTDRCFTETRRKQFNKAVESPVDSVYQMCTSSSYQKEYLRHASCLKSTLTEDIHCGRYYKQLVAHAQGPRETGRSDLCCSHHRFRECVLTETRRACDDSSKASSSMLASTFSRQILDKALSFLKEQCSTYAPGPGECPGFQPPSTREEENVIRSSTGTQPETETRYPFDDQVFSDSFQPTMENRGTVNPTSWIPSSRDGRRKTTKTAEYDFTTAESKTTKILPEVISPASSRSGHGRGMSMNPTESTSREDIFRATRFKATTESWFPGTNVNFYNPEREINDFHSNQVDEPNQQGLARFDSDSGSESNLPSVSSLCLFAFSLVRYTWI